MKKLCVKLLFFLLINVLLYIFMVYIFLGPGTFISVCSKPNNQQHDLVILGTSHGAVFNLPIVGEILDKNILIIAANASGLIPEKIKLSCFFEAKNKTKEIIYFLDPWVLYSSRWNEDYYVLRGEGIELSFFIKLLENRINPTIIYDYFIGRLTAKSSVFISGLLIPQQQTQPSKKQRNNIVGDTNIRSEKTPEVLMQEIKVQKEIYYNEGLDSKKFTKYSKELEKIILLAKSNNTKIIFIVPPTLMEKMPGINQTITLLEKYRKRYDIKYYDFSTELQDQKLYFDLDHLNPEGIKIFTENYLRKIVQ